MAEQRTRGGCRCGALRYDAIGAPLYSGFCFCADCRRASGSGGIPFMGFPSAALTVTGETREVRSLSIKGTEAVRNLCSVCGSLVFGGRLGHDASHTIYAGSLDDPSAFVPTVAIFGRDRPAWMPLPPEITVFETMPE